MVEMEVSQVYISTQSYPRLVLREKGGESYLQIVIGPFEAVAISIAHHQQRILRPISYDLACSILSEVGARIKKVVITDLHKRTFYAKVYLEGENGTITAIDSRPSDAIALALRTGAPIYVDPVVIEKAGHFQSHPETSAESPAPPAVISSAESADQLDHLRRRLQQAIAKEAYEEAARLRDEISRLENSEPGIR